MLMVSWCGTRVRGVASQALLGFDETIDWFCNEEHKWFDTGAYDPKNHAGNCVNSNNNILSLYGERVQYNICRNLEWQVRPCVLCYYGAHAAA
jgi:hypothetical protein